MMSPVPVSEREKFDRLRLLRSENVGPVTFVRLLERFGTASKALAALPDLAKRGGRTGALKVASVALVTREQEEAERQGLQAVWHGSPEYPALLARIHDAPPLLYAHGSLGLLQRPLVAMVGARNASAGGRQMARQLAAELGEAGWVVVSGLARGIDTAAHAGSLDSGTIAVVAGGADVAYPPENAALQASIAAQGLVISEMPPGTEPQARHFPRRNRIISGLSLGVVVVEATAKSGSLITARTASEQGRDVMAVPGSPLDARSEGPNALIRDGAALIRSVGDVLDALALLRSQPLSEPKQGDFFTVPAALPSDFDLAPARAMINQMLGPTAVMVDEIIRQCQVSPTIVQVILLELELAGRLERQPGNRVALLGGR